MPGVYSPVRRSSKVTVEAMGLDGNKFQITQEGFLAVALQHEIDHLRWLPLCRQIESCKKNNVKRAVKKY